MESALSAGAKFHFPAAPNKIKERFFRAMRPTTVGQAMDYVIAGKAPAGTKNACCATPAEESYRGPRKAC